MWKGEGLWKSWSFQPKGYLLVYPTKLSMVTISETGWGTCIHAQQKDKSELCKTFLRIKALSLVPIEYKAEEGLPGICKWRPRAEVVLTGKVLANMHKVLHSIFRPTKKDNGELVRQIRHCLIHWTFDIACFKTDFLILVCVQLAPCLRVTSQSSPALVRMSLAGGYGTSRLERWSQYNFPSWPLSGQNKTTKLTELNAGL